jgi:hypothetical protein
VSGDGLGGLRAGVALDAHRAVAVLVGPHGTVLAHHTVETAPAHREKGLTDLLRRALAGLGGPATLERVERVVIATSTPTDLLTRPVEPGPAELGLVGVLRIGAPATTSVPPLTGWPSSLADAVRGPVAVVGGGHEYDGREFAPLDVDAVRAFAHACRGAVSAVAVAGADAHMNPAHEERVRGLLAHTLGPGIPIVTSHDVGGAGLLERENTVVLGAAVAPVVRRFTDDVVAALADIGMDADLYLVTGDGTVLPAGHAIRNPLALLGAIDGAARGGAAAVETGLFSQVAGVRTSIHRLRPDTARPPRSELSAAVGAATGEASGTVDRVFFYGDGGRYECVATARRGARELAIRRGADPRTVRVGEVREGAMTYVPVPCVRLRVTASGPVMATGGDMRTAYTHDCDHSPDARNPAGAR